MGIGKRISSLRKGKNLTQEELAKRIGISRAALSHYEKDRREPDSETLKKFADFYNVSIDFLLGRPEYLLGGPNDEFSEKDEKDVAKRMEELRKDITSDQGALSFHGEPMSEEAIESFLESMEHIMKQTQRINKKYIPKKYREDTK